VGEAAREAAVTARAPLLLALALAACGVKAAPRPAASSGVERPTGAPSAPAPAAPATPAAPCDPAAGGTCPR
jgi:hypothetical protein